MVRLRRRAHRSVRRANERSPMTTNQKGAVAEAKIAAAALDLGLDVYRPLFEGGRYDLIFGLGRDLLRVQCKWANRRGDVVSVNLQTSRRGNTGHLRTSYTEDEIDALAAYCAELDQCWLLPASKVAGRRQIHLRCDRQRTSRWPV